MAINVILMTLALQNHFLRYRERRAGNSQLDKISGIRELLSRIWKISDVDLNDNHNTLLHVAVGKGHIEVVKLCLEPGADVTIKNRSNDTPIGVASSLDNSQHRDKENIIEELDRALEKSKQMDMKRKHSLPTSGSSSKSEKSNEKRPKTNVEMKRSGAEESQQETEIRRKIINGEELLSAATQDNLVEVKRLIREKADISCADKEGNTALHHAVRNRNAEIVQLFLNYEEVGDIIHVGNKNGATALGIARDSNEKGIVKKIEKKILNDSLKILKSLTEEAVPSTVGESNSQVKPDTTDKITKKLKICLEALKKLVEEDVRRFTCESANVFLFFLETFALADLELNQDENDEFIKKCIGKPDNDLVKSIRNYLIHRKGEEIIKPNYLQKFVVSKDLQVNIIQFFRDLRDYTQGVYNTWDNRQGEANKKNLTEILKLNSSKNPRRKRETKNDVLDSFGILVKEAYTMGQESKKTEEIMFDLIVNIIPLIGEDLGKKLKEIKDLRNDLIHNFHQYKNLDSRMLKIKETIFNVRSKAFHYYSSREIHNELFKICLDAECENIEGTLNNKLKGFEKKFNENQENEHNILKESEVEKSFEYVLSQPLFQKKDEIDVETSVGEYFKFMIIIDDENREEENQIDYEERSKTSKQYKELNDAERREIFEDFKRLEKLQTSSDNLDERQQRQVELKRKLGEYGIREDQFDEVIRLYIEASNVPDKQVVKKVADVIKNLMSLQTSNKLKSYKISVEDIASLYECFAKEKDDFCLDNHKDLLKNYGLTDDAKELIKTNLNILPGNENVDIKIGVKNIRICIFKVVNNILRTFYNAYHKYRTDFTDVEALFGNEIFLDYLVSLDIKTIEPENFEFKDKKHVFFIIKKLLKLKYTAPYIASLLTKVGSDEVIEKADYIQLIEILLKKDSYITYLNKLLHVDSKKPDFNLYEVVYNRILETDDVNIQSMRAILDDPKHVKKTLDVLGTKIDSFKDSTPHDLLFSRTVELTKNVLKLLNNIALKLIYKGKYEEALERLSDKSGVELIYKKLNDKMLIESDDSIIIERKLNIAKAKAAQGRENTAQGRENTEQVKLIEALKVLEEEIPVTESPLFLLTLSRKAYVHNLLKRYDDAYKGYDTLYKEIEKWVLDPDVGTTSNTKDTKEIYSEIKKSKKYQDLLTFSNECKIYLNIVTIKGGLAYSKLMQGKKNSKDKKGSYKKALQIYEDVYNLNKEDSEKEYENNFPILRKIAFIHHSMGEVLFNSGKHLDRTLALEHYYIDLAVQNRILERTRKIHGDYHQNTETAIKYTIIALETIERADITLGSLEKLFTPTNRAQKYYEALEITQQICQFKRSNIAEDDECVAKLLGHIAHIYDKLSRLKSSSDLKEALKNCDKMIETCKEVIRIRENLCVKNETLLTGTQRQLERGKSWKEELLLKQQMTHSIYPKNKVSANKCLPSTSGHSGR